MVDIYRTDEEQIEAIKRWWKSDGLQTIGLIAAVIIAYFAWQGWQQHSLNQRLSASDVYQQLLDIDASGASLTTVDEQSSALALIELLQAEHKGSYADYASLYAAKYAVMRGDLSKAEAELTQLLSQKLDEEIELVARLRLARVLYAAGDYQGALANIVFDEHEAWFAGKYELQGDIYAELGEYAQAQSAYEAALTLAPGALAERGLTLKLASINAKLDQADE